jgi:hypothetical protein
MTEEQLGTSMPVYYAAEDSPSPSKFRFLRWIALLPGALIGSLIAPAAVFICSWLFGSENPSRFDHLWVAVLQSIAMGAAFVWVGSSVAPDHKGKVALILAGTAIFVLGGMAVMFFPTHQWMNLAHVLISAAAAGVTGYILHAENA